MYNNCISFFLQVVVEPSSAIGVAAVMSEKMADMDSNLRNIAVVLRQSSCLL